MRAATPCFVGGSALSMVNSNPQPFAFSVGERLPFHFEPLSFRLSTVFFQELFRRACGPITRHDDPLSMDEACLRRCEGSGRRPGARPRTDRDYGDAVVPGSLESGLGLCGPPESASPV